MSAFWLLHVPAGEFWSVDDPVAWSLENTRQPILERAKEGLLAISPNPDPNRVIRLVVRRCRLNLIEVLENRVVVHFWGNGGLGDLRPFFKQQSLSRTAKEVFLIDRKREAIKICPANDFLYGEPLEAFPWDQYLRKWQRRKRELCSLDRAEKLLVFRTIRSVRQL